ncbi:MAG: DEAD/DEAH box helicase [Bacteroidetes bacterium]|nr:DEAD/DEAH box helicase [Bacteroidota bacterium]
MSFENLNLIEPILKALKTEGYTTPTPIQAQAIPLVLHKHDLLACAQTGTGKTAAFAIPIIQLLTEDKTPSQGKKAIKCLVLTPTRELAIQIGESFANYGRNTNLKYKVIFGGVNQYSQVESLRAGVDVLIATPGRLLDLMNQRHVDISNIKFFVLDEADRMLDMGFIHDVKKVIAKLPAKRQSLFFSATMPPVIVKLADTILVNPSKVEVTPVSSTAEKINQVVYFVDKENKKPLLIDILKNNKIERVLVFTRTKHGADKVVKDLVKVGIQAQAIHGNKSQNARQNALNNFKSKLTRVLVATDIAARGIDIDELSHVINYELPNIPESYVHRIGRTGRAGASGIAIAFCDAEEKEYLRDIQKLIGKTIPVIDDHAYELKNHTVVKTPQKQQQRRSGSSQRNASRGHSTSNSSASRGQGKPRSSSRTESSASQKPSNGNREQTRSTEGSKPKKKWFGAERRPS